jgi:hypothetical protein
MHSPSILFLALVALAAARPLPLNINLGAYSPALVVGDGAIEIEGEGAGGAPQLINSLQGGGIGGGQVAGAQPAAGQRAQVAGPGILSDRMMGYGGLLNKAWTYAVALQLGPGSWATNWLSSARVYLER